MKRQAVILAAGKGTRMRSNLPKVLHTLAGKRLIEHVISAARGFGARDCVVVLGHGSEQTKAAIASDQIQVAYQEEQLGTGHAVLQALPLLEKDAQVLILYGDVPLVTPELLNSFSERAGQADLAILSVQMDNPTGYGRIIKNELGHVTEIVEEKDANSQQKSIREVNSGIYLVKENLLTSLLPKLSNANAQKEYLLTDLVSLAVASGVKVLSCQFEDAFSVSGVNDRKQLAELERYYQRKKADEFLGLGLSIRDPSRFDVRGELSFGSDVTVDINAVFEGSVVLADNVYIGPNCFLKNVTIESGTRIEAFSHLEDVLVGPDCSVGPYARLRPGTRLQQGVKIGNFVETKKVDVGAFSKVNHLSYVGDASIGKSVNIGAGTIFCNYDGVNKHQSLVEDDVFLGSNCSLVAPVKIAKGATVAAGSTVTEDAPAGQLTLARSRQVTLPDWQRPVKKKKDE